ncbi:MAG: hypothetical protein M3121_01340 [Chloroflexota bacterium]|nr:hypothetical protein [Chloroflexota bacterium]
MPDKKSKDQLLDLLDRKAFGPVLEASPDDYKSERDKERLKDLQETTRKTEESYQKVSSAEEVRERFRDDLRSEAAKKVHGELRSLDLPTLNDIEDEFEALYDKLNQKG